MIFTLTSVVKRSTEIMLRRINGCYRETRPSTIDTEGISGPSHLVSIYTVYCIHRVKPAMLCLKRQCVAMCVQLTENQPRFFRVCTRSKITQASISPLQELCQIVKLALHSHQVMPFIMASCGQVTRICKYEAQGVLLSHVPHSA